LSPLLMLFINVIFVRYVKFIAVLN
jgi:hypothetical protein